jgi:hypothetical protein
MKNERPAADDQALGSTHAISLLIGGEGWLGPLPARLRPLPGRLKCVAARTDPYGNRTERPTQNRSWTRLQRRRDCGALK